MKIATFNVNGINGRLPLLLEWLGEAQPDVACLQELKSPDEKFPAGAIEKAGYGAIWHGQPRWNGVAILARGCEPVETRRGLPDDPDPSHSRYIEAAVGGVLVGCLYAPNGNPVPGPEVRLQARLAGAADRSRGRLARARRPGRPRRRLQRHPDRARRLQARALAPTTPCSSPSRAPCYRRLLEQGWTDAIRHLHPDERIYTFWDYWRNAWARNAGIRIDHLLLNTPGRRAARGRRRRPRCPRPPPCQRPCAGLGDVDGRLVSRPGRAATAPGSRRLGPSQAWQRPEENRCPGEDSNLHALASAST